MINKKNILELLEAHLDKIVLGLIGVVSLYLLWAFIVGTPYGAEVDGRNLGPGQIDLRNRQQAQVLAEVVNESGDPIVYDQKIAADFEAVLQCTLPELAVNLSFPYPGVGSQIPDEIRTYPIPEIVPLSEVQVALLRGAVHKPTSDIGPDTPYASAATDLGDLDLVTVSGRIDVQTLYRNFQQSFMGPRLNVAWREPAFAKPVFARIELQRRQQLSDGNWGDWSVVPPTQIDPFRKLIGQTPMTTEQMEFGGVMMWTKQYQDTRVQTDLLQPVPYDFASIQTSWLPPKYLEEALTIIKKKEDELRRTTREERLRAREAGPGQDGMEMMMDPMMGGGQPPARETRPAGRPKPQPRTPARTATPARGGRDNTAPGGGMPGMPGMMDPAATTARTAAAAKRERTLEDIQKDMDKDRITEKTKLESQSSPLLVWVHDDTAKPDSTYQYRIRLGVFNPIAGRDWFSENQKQYKNQVVLWSPYSQPAKEVYVPKMMHLFPTEVLTKDAVGGIKVDVAKYYLGQWHTHEFEVFPGQIIGQSVEVTPKTPVANQVTGMEMEMMMDPGMGTTPSAPQTVDFTTPYMLVDFNSRVDWGTTFNRTEYSQILYWGPEQVLLTMAIGKANWAAEMRRDYTDVKDAEQNAMPLNMSRTTVPGMMMPGMPGEMPGMPVMPGMPAF